MSTRTENAPARPKVDGVKRARILIVESRFHPDIADSLIAGAEREIKKNGATSERVVVPGAFEIPGAIALAADRYDGFVALGCVIRGETTHYDYVCGESARGLMDLSVHSKLAIGYGIVTVETMEQAKARAETNRGDKGGDAAHACLAMVALRRLWGLSGRRRLKRPGRNS
jgi:6,7-dimethyl-8-ribityllumazine synthase